MEQLKVKNWDQYQHYKTRNPPWIKLHVKLLNDRTFTDLNCYQRGLLMQLWILASENEGSFPNDIEEIKFRLRDNKIRQKDINMLIDKGFLNGCKQTQAQARRRTHSVSVSPLSLLCIDDAVSMSDKDTLSLLQRTGERVFWMCIDKLGGYKGSTGKTYKSDYKAMLSWVINSVEEDLKKKGEAFFHKSELEIKPPAQLLKCHKCGHKGPDVRKINGKDWCIDCYQRFG